MGYRGKVVEQEQARELRALGWTMPDIAVKLGVSKGSVSLWVRARIYLHQGLDLDGALSYWSEVTGVPMDQFGKPYRAVPDVGIRHNKHEHGCATFIYSCTRTHRAIMGLCRALLSCDARPFRGGEIGITRAC